MWSRMSCGRVCVVVLSANISAKPQMVLLLTKPLFTPTSRCCVLTYTWKRKNNTDCTRTEEFPSKFDLLHPYHFFITKYNHQERTFRVYSQSVLTLPSIAHKPLIELNQSNRRHGSHVDLPTSSAYRPLFYIYITPNRVKTRYCSYSRPPGCHCRACATEPARNGRDYPDSNLICQSTTTRTGARQYLPKAILR